VIERYLWFFGSWDRAIELFDRWLRYEDLVTDTEKTIAKISKLLSCDLKMFYRWDPGSVHHTMLKLERHDSRGAHALVPLVEQQANIRCVNKIGKFKVGHYGLPGHISDLGIGR
jgi:hypothetical protein